MKNFLTAILLTLGLGFASAQQTAPRTDTKNQPVSKTKAVTTDTKTAKPATTPAKQVKLKSDGTPDKRYKENKRLKKDGTPDKRYKQNK